jgi:tetratricopeptide (TPR) repeat protein
VDWTEAIVRLVTAIPKPIGRALVFPTLIVPSIRKADRVLRVIAKLDQLEAEESFDAAEELREDALHRTESGFSSPLWLSKGFDRLRRGRPDEALKAFEEGLEHSLDHATMVGVSQPHALYYGAAIAALELGELDKAKGYYRHAANLLADQVKRDWALPWLERLEHPRRRLGEPSPGTSAV